MTTMVATATRLTSTSPDLPPALFGYAAMHQAMHRDAERLVLTLAAGAADWAALVRWWLRFHDVILRHHVREDDLIWPALAAADPTFEADVAAMHEDHAELDDAMARLDATLTAQRLAGRALDEALAAAGTFQRVLTEHIEREEYVAFHRLATRLDLWAEIDDQIVREVSVREAAFDLPWMHDSLGRDRSSYLMTLIPGFARPILWLIWRPRYARIVAAAHRTAATA